MCSVPLNALIPHDLLFFNHVWLDAQLGAFLPIDVLPSLEKRGHHRRGTWMCVPVFADTPHETWNLNMYTYVYIYIKIHMHKHLHIYIH